MIDSETLTFLQDSDPITWLILQDFLEDHGLVGLEVVLGAGIGIRKGLWSWWKTQTWSGTQEFSRTKSWSGLCTQSRSGSRSWSRSWSWTRSRSVSGEFQYAMAGANCVYNT